MIGYYVHSVGRGHLRNASCIAAALAGEVTGLSSSPRPPDWPGDWIRLERDDLATSVEDPGAHGRLHWAPLHDAGLSARMARVAAWIDDARPAAMVVDVSVEIAVFARLMGIPTVVMALPGDRSDDAHQLGYACADAALAAWPAGLAGLDRDLSPYRARIHHVGGLSRFAGRPTGTPAPSGRPRVLVLQGSGGTSVGAADVAAAAAATPDWDWQRLGPGAWSEDPWPALCSADVVVTHAGLGALADVATAGRPAIVIPEERPHDEQLATARALAEAGLAVTVPSWPDGPRWTELLDRALCIGGATWHRWRTAGAADRAARVVEAVADGRPAGSGTSCASR